MRETDGTPRNPSIFTHNIKEQITKTTPTMGKFIDPFNDWGFKRIFGQEVKGKGFTLDMISEMTGLSPEEIALL